MPEDTRRRTKQKIIMEDNYLTSGDLALIENRRGYGYGDTKIFDYFTLKMEKDMLK